MIQIFSLKIKDFSQYMYMKPSVLLTTALIPSVLMALSANFLQLSGEYQNLLESFTTGLLIVSGAFLLHDIEGSSSTMTMGIFGFITALLFINIVSSYGESGGILSSLYFDSVSDGMLLGTMLTKLGSLKNVLPILIPMTFEMIITASSSVSMLGSQDSMSKQEVTLAAVLLGLSIFLGSYLGRVINKNFIIGFGAAAMLWLGLCEFTPKVLKAVKSKDEETKTNVAIFSGVLGGMFLGGH